MKYLAILLLAACGANVPIGLGDTWPTKPTADYDDVVRAWTRRATLRGQYQEAAELYAVFLSPDWRFAKADRDAANQGVHGAERDAVFAKAQADMAGPYEVELLFTTWDRTENDLDRGTKSVWRVVLVDDSGKEIEPIEIVKDWRKKRTNQIRADFPDYGDFAVAYVARFPRTAAILGPNVKSIRLRMSSARGGLEVGWEPTQ